MGLSAILVVACGGKVFFDPGTVGGAGGAGGGAGGAGGGGDLCELLGADLQAKLKEAQACNPLLSVLQCSADAIVLDSCGCEQAANQLSPIAVEAARDAFDTWVAAGCGPFDCFSCPPPPSSTTWFCDPAESSCVPGVVTP